jgi:hypothetical protein
VGQPARGGAFEARLTFEGDADEVAKAFLKKGNSYKTATGSERFTFQQMVERVTRLPMY